jgi:hypothetical protein
MLGGFFYIVFIKTKNNDNNDKVKICIINKNAQH